MIQWFDCEQSSLVGKVHRFGSESGCERDGTRVSVTEQQRLNVEHLCSSQHIFPSEKQIYTRYHFKGKGCSEIVDLNEFICMFLDVSFWLFICTFPQCLGSVLYVWDQSAFDSVLLCLLSFGDVNLWAAHHRPIGIIVMYMSVCS